MKIAIVTVTTGGVNKSLLVSKKLNCDDIKVFTLKKYAKPGCEIIKGTLKEEVPYLFKNFAVILFIMATGIVVRVIADEIKDKTIDPAILVMDEKGKYIISLLSGHLGGANKYAEYIGMKIGAQPVITTSSDVNKTIAVDILAQELGCKIDNMNRAKNITAMIVNCEKVNIVSDIEIKKNFPENIKLGNNENTKGTIYISSRKTKAESDNIVHLIPENIVLGIGCRKGIETNKVIDFVNEILSNLEIDKRAVKNICSIDIKKNEKGLIETAKYFDVKLLIVSKEEILKVEHLFDSSDRVKEAVGVGSVCEPCGYVISNKGKCLQGKVSKNGVTVSVWEDVLWQKYM